MTNSSTTRPSNEGSNTKEKNGVFNASDIFTDNNSKFFNKINFSIRIINNVNEIGEEFTIIKTVDPKRKLPTKDENGSMDGLNK